MMFQKVGRNSENEGFGIEYLDSLYGYALMLTRNSVEAEDLVQETYVRALKAQHRLREDSNIKGWFFTILRNIRLNEIRKGKTGPHLVDVDGEEGGADLLPGHTRNSQEILIGKEDAEQVQVAIGRLSAEFREVILLREFEELSYQEIAVVLNCPAGTVMSRLGRARAKLRTLLAETSSQPLSYRKASR
ncbi:sigma-70 family RNA polymerase sigma factor [Granulicella sp. S190]|uniref:sigma-70 family RNA polymerase sigma factor n=1 Tax=Granulicella sp. S190 TaxID=1747226 RepID=UPI00131BD34F|nr:sigma-70 family RNA polymerase sigma factor [Granulicella sp. S190]